MSDLYCRKCAEPWDAYGIEHGDMKRKEAERFKRGEGCPSCGFGKTCTQCGGTGTTKMEQYDPNYCSTCYGDGRVRVRRLVRPRFPNDRMGLWFFGFGGSARYGEVSPYSVDSRHYTREGVAQEGWAWCPDCENSGSKCPVCEGSGEFNQDAEGDHLELALSSLVDSTDEDPIEYLMNYEL